MTVNLFTTFFVLVSLLVFVGIILVRRKHNLTLVPFFLANLVILGAIEYFLLPRWGAIFYVMMGCTTLLVAFLAALPITSLFEDAFWPKLMVPEVPDD